MKNVCFSLFLLAAVVICPAQAQPTPGKAPGSALVVSTGTEGGGYWSAGERLAAVAAEHRMSVEVVESTGSAENIELLMDPASPVTLAFAQADAIQLYLKRNPEAGKAAEALENIGSECVYILTASNSGLEELDDLVDEAQDLTIFVGSQTSGTAATFDSISDLVPALKEASVRYGDTTAAVETLLNVPDSPNAVMVVHRPRANSPEVDTAIANPEKIQFVEIDDEDLRATLPNGESVYQTIPMTLPGAQKQVSTVCVKGYLLVSKTKLKPQHLSELTALIRFNWMRVYATP